MLNNLEIHIHVCIPLFIIYDNLIGLRNKKTNYSHKSSIMDLNPFTKLNLNQYHYKLKSISTSEQKYNSKFQEFETVRALTV